VGLNNVPEPWKSIPWRFVGKNPFPAQKSKRWFSQGDGVS
jgi:hypothetical protein